MEITIKEKIVHIINQKKKSIFEWNKMTCPTYWGHHNDSFFFGVALNF